MTSPGSTSIGFFFWLGIGANAGVSSGGGVAAGGSPVSGAAPCAGTAGWSGGPPAGSVSGGAACNGAATAMDPSVTSTKRNGQGGVRGRTARDYTRAPRQRRAYIERQVRLARVQFVARACMASDRSTLQI